MGKEEVRIRLGKKDPLVVGNKVFKSSNVWNLTEKELEKARIELGETEERRQKCLQELKRRLSKEGNYRTDDSFLLRYLRFRKFDCDKAYHSVCHLYDTRKNNEFFGTPPNLRYSKDTKFVTFLPYADEEGRILIWVDVEGWNLRESSFGETFHLMAATLEIFSMNPKCQVNGIISVWDMKKFSFMQLYQFLRKNRLFTLYSVMLKCIPWRIKKVLLFNSGYTTKLLYNLFRPLLSRKIIERIIFLGSDPNELHQHINPVLLPKKLGGSLEDDECNVFAQVVENIPYLEYERSFSGE